MKTEYNTKLDTQLETFIQLRIEGNSFDTIATELKTTKQTLIEWNKKELVRKTIIEAKAIKINTLVKTFEFDLHTRVKTYLELSKKINDELANRDLKEVSTEALLKMSIATENRIKEIVSKQIEFGIKPYTVDMNEGNTFFELYLDE
jgi:hypothetical protein